MIHRLANAISVNRFDDSLALVRMLKDSGGESARALKNEAAYSFSLLAWNP